MGQEYRGRVFKSGNSVALRLPKALGLAEGTEVRIVDQGRGSLLVETSPSRQKIDVDSFWGSVPGIALPEDHDRTFADRPSSQRCR